jgi:hypothetical protein
MTTTQLPILSIADSIRMFVRSLGANPESAKPRQQADEADLIDALRSIKYYFHSHISQDAPASIDALKDVKRDIEEYLFMGATRQECTLKRCSNFGMYVLVIEPAITLLGSLTPPSQEQTDRVIANIVDLVVQSDAECDYSDTLVAREQIRQAVTKYQELHMDASGTRRKAKRKFTVLEILEREYGTKGIDNDDQVETLNFDD